MVTTAAPFLTDYLEGVRVGVNDAVAASLPAGGPRASLYSPLTEFVGRAGKSIRPALCIAAARSHGATTERVMPSAVALELLHNAFLVHDDIEDGSTSRRGLPTMHAEHGVPIAINVGDAMCVLSIEPLMRNLESLGAELTWDVFVEIQHMVKQSVEGQAMELGWVRDNVIARV